MNRFSTWISTSSGKVLLGGVSLGLLAAGMAYFGWEPAPPSAEEFFRRNPHLTPPVSHLATRDVERTSDAFQEGDYQLKQGFAYPIALKHEMKLKGPKADLLDFGFSGDLRLHSLGVKDRKLSLIAEFHFKEARGHLKLTERGKMELGMKKAQALAPGEKMEPHLLLLRLDPAGRILEVHAATVPEDESATEVRITALSLLFRKIPKLEAGASLQTEADDRGVPFPVRYTISKTGEELYRILGKIALDQKLGGSPKKAAAAGAPDIALVALESNREQNLDWLWSKKDGVPRTQAFASVSEVRHERSTLSSAVAKASTQWGDVVKATYTREDESAFSIPVDFKSYLGRTGNRLRQASDGKARPLGRSWNELMLGLQHLKGSKLSENQKEELFLELARAVKDDPSLIGRIKEAAMRAASGSRELSMLLGALGYEGSPESQAAMIEIYKRLDATEDERQKVLTEFALAPRPLTRETKDFLKDRYGEEDPLKSDTSSTAGLALGASLARDGDPQTVLFLRKEWEKAEGKILVNQYQNVSQQAYVLTAMGNSKSDAFLSEVKEAASSGDAELRSAAINSVRFAQDAESRKILFHALERDPDEEVRITAAQSLMYQPYDQTTRGGLEKCAGSSVLGVKIECYRVLGSRIEQPGVREFLRSRLGSESDPQVQSVIRGALSIQE